MQKFDREISLIGRKNFEKLQKSKVAVFGIGGVGSFVVEGLIRGGIGHIILVDNDMISESNINRQIHANINTLGRKKVEVMKERILAINPEVKIDIYYVPDLKIEEQNIIDSTLDYVIDAVDTIETKIKLIEKCKQENIKIISCMGTGNKLDPTRFEITDISKTSVCPLARVIRKELNKRNIKDVKVLYSKEETVKNKCTDEEGKITPASISFVPSVAGLIIAGEVIKDIINLK